MKLKLTAATAAIALVSQMGFAADSAQQTVTYEVAAINQLSVSGSPEPMLISTAVAGQAPTPVTDTSTSYNITTNQTNRRITGTLSAPMPPGVTLSLSLEGPDGASSTTQALDDAEAKTLVSGISTLNEENLGISYQLAATSAAGVVASANTTVTLTITAAAD